ncbi:uncharacterized protein LOC143983219 isoform X3 [Lithobates pipiens]
MDVKYIFCIFFTWLILNIGESASTNMFPMITEPKKNTVLAVLPGSDIDLNCSADLGDMIEGIFTQIFWIINGNFTDCYDKVNESNVITLGNYNACHPYRFVLTGGVSMHVLPNCQKCCTLNKQDLRISWIYS